MLPSKVSRLQPNVIEVTFDGLKQGFEQWLLIRSDAHHDSLLCNRALELKHLKQAKERKAVIIDTGDGFDAMGGKWDKRADETQMRSEYRGGNYLDKLVNFAADFYEPFAQNFIMFSQGNHETAILKRHETNLVERLVERLNTKTGSGIIAGTYAGWIKFRFNGSGQKPKAPVLVLYFHHGAGGSSPVTRGVIDTARMGLYLPDADIVTCGHVHHAYEMPITRLRLTSKGSCTTDTQTHLRTPGYKEEISCGQGWAVEKAMAPKPQGAAWVRFYVEPGDLEESRISYEVTRAK